MGLRRIKAKLAAAGAHWPHCCFHPSPQSDSCAPSYRNQASWSIPSLLFFSSPPSEQNLPSLFLARWPLRCVGLLSHRSSQRMTTRLPLFDRRLPSRLPPPTTLSLYFWPDTWFLRRAFETCEFQRSFFFFVTVSSNRSIWNLCMFSFFAALVYRLSVFIKWLIRYYIIAKGPTARCSHGLITTCQFGTSWSKVQFTILNIPYQYKIDISRLYGNISP